MEYYKKPQIRDNDNLKKLKKKFKTKQELKFDNFKNSDFPEFENPDLQNPFQNNLNFDQHFQTSNKASPNQADQNRYGFNVSQYEEEYMKDHFKCIRGDIQHDKEFEQINEEIFKILENSEQQSFTPEEFDAFWENIRVSIEWWLVSKEGFAQEFELDDYDKNYADQNQYLFRTCQENIMLIIQKENDLQKYQDYSHSYNEAFTESSFPKLSQQSKDQDF